MRVKRMNEIDGGAYQLITKESVNGYGLESEVYTDVNVLISTLTSTQLHHARNIQSMNYGEEIILENAVKERPKKLSAEDAMATSPAEGWGSKTE